MKMINNSYFFKGHVLFVWPSHEPHVTGFRFVPALMTEVLLAMRSGAMGLGFGWDGIGQVISAESMLEQKGLILS